MQIPKSSRYEIKMVTEHLMLPQVRSWLRVHSAAFSEVYSPRQINNVYFDSPHLTSFAENLAGVSERRKTRLRWYGKDTYNVQGILEIKCKRNMYGWKRSQNLSNILDLHNTSWDELLKSIRSELTQEILNYLDSNSYPVLLNQYQREYYLSFDRKVRITIDFAQAVFDQRLSSKPNLSFSVPPSKDVVIEVKANTEDREYLEAIITDIPLRVSKHSKYALGMEAILDYKHPN